MGNWDSTNLNLSVDMAEASLAAEARKCYLKESLHWTLSLTGFYKSATGLGEAPLTGSIWPELDYFHASIARRQMRLRPTYHAIIK